MLLLGCTCFVRGGYTPVGALAEDEASRLTILNSVYGGTFSFDQTNSPEGVRNYTNGTVNARRVEDVTPDNDVVSVIGAPGGKGGSASDQLWTDGTFSARAIAKFSLYSQTFGFFDGESGGSFNKLFDVGGNDLNVTGEAKAVDLKAQTFRWARTGETGTHTSADLDNQDQRDHMLTYVITGVPGDTSSQLRWALFFEDLDLNDVRRAGRTTSDFNDLAIEITTGIGTGSGTGSNGGNGDNGAVAVPLPPAVWPALISLAFAGYTMKKARRLLH